MKKLFCIKEICNPLLKKTCYIAKGQLTKKEADKIDKNLSGSDCLYYFKTEEEYLKKISKLVIDGYLIYGFSKEELK